MTDYPPSPPSDIEIDGVPEHEGMDTNAHLSVDFSADLFAVGSPGQHCRLRVVYSVNKDLSGTRYERFSDYVESGSRAHVRLGGLHDGKRYYVRAWTQHRATNWYSKSYAAADFWTGGERHVATTHAGHDDPDGGAGGVSDSDYYLNHQPSVATDIRVNGKPEAAAMGTKSTGTVTISALLHDPDESNTHGQESVRMLVKVSPDKAMTHAREKFSPYTGHEQVLNFPEDGVGGGGQGGGNVRRREVTFNGLDIDTLYYYRVYTQDKDGKWARVKGGPDEGKRAYNSGSFWTNRRPVVTLQQPSENAHFPESSDMTFIWKSKDPDPDDTQSGYEFRYRTSATITKPAGDWQVISRPKKTEPVRVVKGGTFRPNTFYDWSVRTKDEQDFWSAWAPFRSLFVDKDSTPPRLLAPINGSARDAHSDITFEWKFRSPREGDEQVRADLRYRVAGHDDSEWITWLGDNNTSQRWALPADTFGSGYRYEWQVRTYTSPTDDASDWSESEFFHAIGTPGSAGVPLASDIEPLIQGELGCGKHEVWFYERGGEHAIGKVGAISTLRYGRVRDDISEASLFCTGFDDDCGALYKDIHSWMHEVVIFRDGKRVWEGPVTLIEYGKDYVKFEAKDVMAYVYRRIMRQGFNDAYRIVEDGDDEIQVGLLTSVERAEQLILDALAPADPNVLPYLTAIKFDGDARQSRVMADYSATAWEVIDDFAANQGLDYVTVGRRIILNDTHRAVGRLPEMRDKDFADPPIVTEYGMQLANYYGVTNGSGIWGAARPQDELYDYESYGPIEMLSSAYGQTGAATDDEMTPEAIRKMRVAMNQQAGRNIAARWPAPVVVRVPDNTQVLPNAGISFEQLIPGVWVPLTSTSTLREVSQWQKLDSMTVEVDAAGGEKVRVVLSPAPNRGQDPDAGVDVADNADKSVIDDQTEDQPLPDFDPDPDIGSDVLGPGDMSLPMIIGMWGRFDQFNDVLMDTSGQKEGGVNYGMSMRRVHNETRELETYDLSQTRGDVGRDVISYLTWNPTQAWLNSFLGSPAKQAAMLAFFDSWPTDHVGYMSFGVDPQIVGYKPEDFKKFQALIWTIKQASVNAATLHYAPLMDALEMGANHAQWMPEGGEFDFVGIRIEDRWRDKYAPNPHGTRHDPAYWLDDAAAFADDASKPLVIGDYRLHPDPNVDIDRPYRIANMVFEAEDRGAEAFVFFNHYNPETKEPWWLESFPDWGKPKDRSDSDIQTVVKLRQVLADHIKYGQDGA